MNQVAIRYSLSFKLQVVRELEAGRFHSRLEARKFYGINGNCTISRWVDKYGSQGHKRKVIRVESIGELSDIEALKARIAELERAVIDSKVQECLYKAYFDIVCREYGVSDPDGLKKNIDKKLLQQHTAMDREKNT